MRLGLGNPVRCADDPVCRLVDVVVDASSNRVTHLVVQPDKRPESARLVPIELAEDEPNGRGTIALRCTAEALRRLEPVREYAFVRPGEPVGRDPRWDVGVEDVSATPDYVPSGFGDYVADLDLDVGVAYDRIPSGEIELRHASAVYSADRHRVGCVRGLLVDAEDRVTHVLLERGRFWWRREIAIPADAVASYETDVVTLRVAKRELGAFRAG